MADCFGAISTPIRALATNTLPPLGATPKPPTPMPSPGRGVAAMA